MDEKNIPKPWRKPKVVTSVISGILLLTGWLLGLAGLSEMISFSGLRMLRGEFPETVAGCHWCMFCQNFRSMLPE